MAVTELATQLEVLLESEAKGHGFELVAVEQAGGHKTPVIRVFLDREGGIDLESLARANAWVSASIDDSDALRGPYTLEVSSPGIDRPLRKLADFERFAGETANVKVRSAAGGRSAWTGRLLGVRDDSVVIEVDGAEVLIPHSEIVKARLKGVIDFGKGGSR